MLGFGRIKCFRLSKSEDEFVEAEDLEALQALFTKYCDKEGLMTKEKVTKIPPIDEFLVSVHKRKNWCFRLCSRIAPWHYFTLQTFKAC